MTTTELTQICRTDGISRQGGRDVKSERGGEGREKANIAEMEEERGSGKSGRD